MKFICLIILVTLVFVQPALAMPRLSHELKGIVEEVIVPAKSISILPNDGQNARTFRWKANTQFIQNQRFVSYADIKEGQYVKVRYREPLFGEPFVIKVEWAGGDYIPLETGDK